MDLLSQLLSSLTIESTSISRWHMSSPWGVEVQGFAPGYCLTVVEGACQLKPHGQEPFTLNTGDTFLALRGGDCALMSATGVTTTAISDLPWEGDAFQGLDAQHRPATAQKVTWGLGGVSCRLLGLAFTFRHNSSNFLLNTLPQYLHLQHNSLEMLPLTQPAINSLINDSQPGYVAVASQLAELIIISLIRTVLLNHDPSASGWLKGLQDRHIHKALSAIHTNPQKKWSLVALAQQAHLSRSSFAEQFRQCVGVPPMEYVNRWRVQLACDLLRETRMPISEVAEQVGFQSDRVFRRVFHHTTGLAPTTFRNQLNAST